MNERIRKLRKALELTQQEFASQLKISRGALATYEVGRNEPLDAVIHSICREFNVNEQWLRTGQGEMFNPEPVDVLDALAAEYGLGRRERIFVEKLLTLKPDAREAALNYLVDVVNAINQEETQQHSVNKPHEMTLEEMQAEVARQYADEKEHTDGSEDSGSGNSGTATA